MNCKKLLAMAIIALLACGSAEAQSMLGRLANRAKNAAENAVGKKIENAIYNAVDNAMPKEKEAANTAAPVTDPIPRAVSFKYTDGDGSEGLYYVYTRAEGRSRSDRFEEGEALNENDVLEKYSYHDVMLLPKRGETPVKYEDNRWTESYSALQELSIMWLALIDDRSEFYVQKDGFKEVGTAVVCGKTCTKYAGTIKTMGGYDKFIMNGSSAEIYTWNGYTMKLVMGGKVIFEVVGYTELVPESAFTQTLDVNWF